MKKSSMKNTVSDLDERISAKEREVADLKRQYEKGMKELTDMKKKRKKTADDLILDAYHGSNRSLDECLTFFGKK